MNADDVRSLALSLPEADEQPHFDSASFRVRGHIFVTLPADGEWAHVFVEEDDVHAAVSEQPSFCAELWWGKKLSGVRINLAAADPVLVHELVVDAWRCKAPARLAATLDAGAGSVRAPRRRLPPGR